MYPWDHFAYFGLLHLWGLPVGSWTRWGGTHSYGYIWILTLKRIYAEGLQQGRREKRIGIWRIRRIGVTKRCTPSHPAPYEKLPPRQPNPPLSTPSLFYPEPF